MRWRAAFFFLAMAGCALAQKPATNAAIELNSGWEFRQRVPEKLGTGDIARDLNPSVLPARAESPAQAAAELAQAAQWRPAAVPGVVATDLLRNKLIPDPFYRENEAKLQWLENADWEYRTTIQASPGMLARRRIELVFDGLDGYAEVYLNQKLVLTADNAFRQWRVDVKPALRAGANELLVVFPSPILVARRIAAEDPWRARTGTEDKTYLRKPAYEYGWDWGPRFVNSGIWRPARLEMWDALRIVDFHIAQPDVTKDVAHVTAEIEIAASADTNAKIVVAGEGGGKKFDESQNIALHAGANTLRIPFTIEKPELWWPAGYGKQAMYSFELRVAACKDARCAGGPGETPGPTLTGTRRTGLRSVVLRRERDEWGRSFEFIVNGVPVFAKGADVIPFDSFPTRVTTAQYRRVLESARDANMNMLRHWGGGYYETDEFYEICDELGLMIWQDFMFGNDWQPGSYAWKQNVEQEVEYQVRRLRDHPSVVIWCGNNETEEAFHWGDRSSLPPDVRLRMWQDYLTVFSGLIPRVVERLEPEVPYWPSSPSGDYEDQTGAYQTGDMHNWQIWHGNEPIRDYEKYFPRFMTEYGFQSFPEMRTVEAFTTPEDRTSILTPVMLAHQKNAAGNQKIHTYMLQEYREPKDFASFLYVSQVLQAQAIKFGAEHLRRIRPRAMGSIYWQLNDCWPVASWSSIDYFGRWKALQFYARRFYAPLLVSPHEENGMISVYVISDSTVAQDGELTVSVMDVNGRVLHSEKKQIKVPPLSSQIYFSAPRAEFVEGAGADPAKTFLATHLEAGKFVSDNNLYLVPARNLDLPQARITSHLQPWPELSKQVPTYRLTLSADKLARNVYISFGEADADLSDNYFDLLPGRSVTLAVETQVPIEELRTAMKVMSLAEAFAAPEAKSVVAPAP